MSCACAFGAHDIGPILAEIRARALRVNNLFQVADHWQANLTGRGEGTVPPICWEFGIGATPELALRAALARVAAKPSGAKSPLSDVSIELGF